MQQRQGQEELHRHPGLPAEHGERLLADGLPGEFPGDRHDHQGSGERKGEAAGGDLLGSRGGENESSASELN